VDEYISGEFQLRGHKNNYGHFFWTVIDRESSKYCQQEVGHCWKAVDL